MKRSPLELVIALAILAALVSGLWLLFPPRVEAAPNPRPVAAAPNADVKQRDFDAYKAQVAQQMAALTKALADYKAANDAAQRKLVGELDALRIAHANTRERVAALEKINAAVCDELKRFDETLLVGTDNAVRELIGAGKRILK